MEEGKKMLKRYSTKRMARIWSDTRKYRGWLNVELAVLQAREKLGLIPVGIFDRIKKQANFSVQRIEFLEDTLKHDLLSFVTNVQENLDPDLRKFFHADGLTSYDTEEPATALQLVDAMRVIFGSLEKFMGALKEKIIEHKYLVKIHRTHGQHAEPITLGHEILWWHDALERQHQAMQNSFRQIQHTKISGAVGTYGGGLSPQLEAEALGYLKLVPAKVSAQIILRDRHARIMNDLAVLAGILEHIALNLRIYGQSELCEIQEPFGKGQKGSSVMPHKKNPIVSENACGLARMVRGYASIALENIPTWSGRDISHSSAERIIFPDSFHLVDFMLGRLTKVIMGMVINKNRIEENLKLTQGMIFSPDVKEFLMKYHNIDPDTAYRECQEMAFRAIKEKRPFLDIVDENLGRLMQEDRPNMVRETSLKLRGICNVSHKVEYTDEVFARFGL